MITSLLFGLVGLGYGGQEAAKRVSDQVEKWQPIDGHKYSGPRVSRKEVASAAKNIKQTLENYRNAAEKDWDNHVLYSKVAIILAGTTVTGWISNSIYAWAFGPRPQSNIYKQGVSDAPSTAG